MKIKTTLTVTLTALAGFTGAMNGQVIFEENFDDITGDLSSDGAWDGFSGTGSPTVTAGVLSVGAGAMDIGTDLGTLSAGTYFFSLDFTVSSAATSSDYVMGFQDGSSLASRIYFDGVTGGFAIGANTGGTGGGSASDFIGGSVTPSVFALDTTYQLISSFDGVSTISIWIDAGTGDLATPDLTIVNADTGIVDGFYFRQGGGWDNGGAAWTADDIIVSSDFASAVPEPSAYALLAGCFALSSVMMRRRTVK